MTDRVVFQPDALEHYATANLDAVGDLLRAQGSYDQAMDAVHASGRPGRWTTTWGTFDDVLAERAALARLGEFTSWLAQRARELDADGGVARLQPSDLWGPRAPSLWDTEALYVRGTQVAAFMMGRIRGGPSEADLAMLALHADNPNFATGLVEVMGGPTGVVDELLRNHRRLATSDGTDGPPLDDDGSRQDLAMITVALGTALGRVTLGPDWGQSDTDELVTIIRAMPGDPAWGPQRAAGLAVLVAAAPRMSSEVVARLLATAVEVDRTEGGPDAWSARADAPDTGLWPQPLLGPTGHPAHDPISTLLIAAGRDPDAALAAFTTGGTVGHVGADGVERRVDVTLAHLIDGHDFDDTGWARLGDALEAAVIPHVGTGAAGRAAAGVTGQSVALLANRVASVGDLPRPLHHATASLLAVAMPGAIPAIVGTDTVGWATDDRSWTLVNPPIYPRGLPIQPILHTDDLEVVLERLGSSPREVERLTALAVANIDLAVANELARPVPDLQVVAAAAGVSADAAGTILATAYDGIVDDHTGIEADRQVFERIGMFVGLVPGLDTVGTGIELGSDVMIHEHAVPTDYRGAQPALLDLINQRTLDTLYVQGWFDDASIPADALRHHDGAAIGFDHHSTAFLEWKTSSPDYPVMITDHLNVQARAVHEPYGSDS